MTAPLEPQVGTSESSGNEQNEGGEQRLSYEEIQAELAKVRREAGSRRIMNREQEEKLKEYEAWKESQMTELEKAQKRASELEVALSEKGKEAARKVAKALYGFDDDDMEFLTGTSEEEILAKAEKLAAKTGKLKGEAGGSGQNPNLFPGTRGTPVGSGATDKNALLRAQLQGER